MLNAPDGFFHLLASFTFFRSWLVHGTVTLPLLACAFLPLFKGSLKEPAKTDSYRAIAGSSLLLELFDNVVLLLWGDCLLAVWIQVWYQHYSVQLDGSGSGKLLPFQRNTLHCDSLGLFQSF
jgi:hypothetical protein